MPKPSRQAADATGIAEGPGEAAPWLVRAILVVLAVCLLAVTLGMTAATLSLDDVKKFIFLVAGPLLMLLGLMAYVTRQAAPPPRAVTVGFAGFAAVLVISSALSSFRWIAADELLMFYAAGGFMVSAVVVASHRHTSEIYFRFLVLLLLITNVIGIVLYDFADTDPATGSMAKWLAAKVPPPAAGEERSWWRLLLLTFSLHEGAMQSTVLSRDFYAGFCICFLPFAMLTMLDPGPGARRRLWRALGGLTTLLTIVCVLKAQSKGEYIIGAVVVFLFFALIFRIEDLPLLRSRVVISLLAGIGVVVFAVLWMMLPVLMHKLKSIDTSMSSREIIWQGAWNVFKERPVIGGGPGTFRIYFPQERSPDYYEHEIANVTLYAHNYFLDLLSETGLLGLGFFAWGLLAAGALAVWMMFKHPRGRLRVMILTSLCALLAIIGSNLSSPNGRWAIGAASLYTVLGLMIGLLVQGRTPAFPPVAIHRSSAKMRGMLAGALVLAVCIPVVGTRTGRNYFQSRIHHLNGYRASMAAQAALEDAGDRAGIQQLFATAIAEYNSSLKWNPASYQSLYQLGYLHTRLAELEADKLSAMMRQSEVNRSEVELQLARMNENLARAIAHYDRLAALWPDYAELHYNLGLLYSKAAQSIRMADALGMKPAFREADAAEWERRAVEQCEIQASMSNRDEVKMLLAQQYVQLERYADGLAVLREAGRTYPRNRKVLQEYHNVAMRAGDAAAQTDALEKLVELDPLDDVTMDLLLNLAAEKRDAGTLLRALDRLEAKDPLDPRIARYRFGLAASANDVEAARAQFNRYVASGGNDEKFLEAARRFVSRLAANAPATSQNP